MEPTTLSYNEMVQGWTSYFSYIPEVMVGMNSYLYSFKGGNLYRHNSDNVPRNNFYGVQYTSKVKSVFNNDILSAKNYKTIHLNGDDPWSVTFNTDIVDGSMNSSWFEQKEGNWWTYLRRNVDDNNLKMRSAQGIGKPLSVNSLDLAAVVVTFNYNIGSIISIGDIAYSETFVKLGEVIAKTNTSITINTVTFTVPLVTDFILYVKNSVAESYGALGYYLVYELENASVDRTELFSVSSNLFKSYP